MGRNESSRTDSKEHLVSSHQPQSGAHFLNSMGIHLTGCDASSNFICWNEAIRYEVEILYCLQSCFCIWIVHQSFNSPISPFSVWLHLRTTNLMSEDAVFQGPNLLFHCWCWTGLSCGISCCNALHNHSTSECAWRKSVRTVRHARDTYQMQHPKGDLC